MSPFAPGIHPGVPWDDYLKLEGVSITRLKELSRSAQHYRHFLLNTKEKSCLSLGRAAHCAVLEPELFESDFAIWARRTDAGAIAPRRGQVWDAFATENAGKEIITLDQYDHAIAMQAAIRGNLDAAPYLASGSPEVTMQWEMAGHRCKGRIDWLAAGDDLVGLKTSRDCRPFQFGQQAARLGYHLQWAYYAGGYQLATGRRPRKVVEIVIEPEPPYAVVVYAIPDDVLLRGEEEYLALLGRLAEYQDHNNWPGPAPGEQILTLPSWVYGEEMEISYVDE